METLSKRQNVESGFRLDIQGLRAVAVALVVLYHLWPDHLHGGYVGVDVFFVISGFLITSHLVRQPPVSWRDLGRFWARRIRRLLPAAFLVLLATSIAARLVAPSTQWAQIAKEVIASGLYVQNWLLAGSSVDYLAAENAQTPVQHFWSLSVEEQFYLFWPLLIAAVVWLTRRTRWRQKSALFAALLTTVVASFAYSVAATAAEPGSAYFITPTRIWELGLGGLIALAGNRIYSFHPRLRAGMAWIGIAGIVAAGTAFTSETAFPGYAALLPVVATVLVIGANSTASGSPTTFLRAKPIQWLGGVSYSIYLWHWPLIVLAPFAAGDEIGLAGKLAILALSLLLAAATKTLVEDKARSAGWFRRTASTYRFAVGGMIVLVIIGSLQLVEVGQRSLRADERLAAETNSGSACLGAAALADPDCGSNQEILTDPAVAKEDKPAAYADGCWNHPPFGSRVTCTYGDGDTEIALVGNSHAGHWLPALQEIAKDRDWTITTFLASACNFTDAKVKFDTPAKTAGCTELGDWAQEATSGDKFDLVISSQLSIPLQGGGSASEQKKLAFDGYSSYLKDWADNGTNVLVLRDTPYPKTEIPSIPDCVAENPDRTDVCSGLSDSWLKPDPMAEAADALGDADISVADLTELLCRDGRCYGVNGGLITYFDGSHLTTAYARTLAPFLEQKITSALQG
ncbi:acyltransferase 3 [Arthrobacter crystallopoietes BAB-32]|uniref:Acyltransferase 3 n=2 Tax=Crystallibacter crystallopoietes TaxID=37928 RepID=N1UXX1_9MICC|nr:acyltransferase family protein [Arthrobacter crystallopoietes]EMY35236.1 acyltransferase 3 [Arthrobacter crystallopoietes BAB-32]